MAVIINADDFGFNSNVNSAVLESFSKSLCSSTTIMPNMPGFEEACELSHQHGLAGCVGLHLVLSEGVPLSDNIKKCARICDREGRFHSSRRKHLFWLDSAEKNAVFEEMCAQVDRCREHGIQLTHVDSHHNVHVEWGVGSILLLVAKDKGLRYIRLGRIWDTRTTWIKRLYRRCFNLRLMTAGFAATRHCCMVEDIEYLKRRKGQNSANDALEIMIHPVFDERRVLIDSISREPLDRHVARVDGYGSAVSFGDMASLSSQSRS